MRIVKTNAQNPQRKMQPNGVSNATPTDKIRIEKKSLTQDTVQELFDKLKVLTNVPSRSSEVSWALAKTSEVSWALAETSEVSKAKVLGPNE